MAEPGWLASAPGWLAYGGKAVTAVLALGVAAYVRNTRQWVKERKPEIAILGFGIFYGGGTWFMVLFSEVAGSGRWSYMMEHVYDSLGAAAIVGSLTYIATQTPKNRTAALYVGGAMAIVGLLTAISASVPLGTHYLLDGGLPALLGAVCVWVWDPAPRTTVSGMKPDKAV